MKKFTISIFESKILLQIINEINLFSKFKIKYYENIDLCLQDAQKENHLVICYNNDLKHSFFDKIQFITSPLILITKSSIKKNILPNDFCEILILPFKILDLNKKIILLIAKYEFKKNSLIKLNDYILDKNERKIKKNNLELQLSEKEINFLVLFKEKRKPINKNYVLKNVLNYSSESETHTIETHIHRLRKKILQKFGDNNFIKNNKIGYYI